VSTSHALAGVKVPFTYHTRARFTPLLYSTNGQVRPTEYRTGPRTEIRLQCYVLVVPLYRIKSEIICGSYFKNVQVILSRGTGKSFRYQNDTYTKLQVYNCLILEATCSSSMVQIILSRGNWKTLSISQRYKHVLLFNLWKLVQAM
jgi:hypothetical protein